MIIFFYGEDTFRLRRKISELKNKFLQKDFAASGLSIFDFGEKSSVLVSKIISVFGTGNLLVSKRFVIIKNLITEGNKDAQDDMLEYLQKNAVQMSSNDDLIVVFGENSQPRKNSALYKFFENPKNEIKIQKFEKLSGTKLEQWIIKKIKTMDEKSDIRKDALLKLISFSGNDTEILNGEIEKLVNYTSGRTIEQEDVEKLVRVNLDNNIFQTIDALANQDKKRALGLLHNHLMKGENAFYIFSMFVYAFRNLIKIMDLKENYQMTEVDIARALAMNHYVVKKGLQQGQKFAFTKLKNIYQRLDDIERDVKVGKINIELALDRFIVEI